MSLSSLSFRAIALSLLSSVSAFLWEETEEEFLRLLLAGSYRCRDLLRFLSLPPRLELLVVLLRRLRGGVMLRLLLRVSRRPLRSRPLGGPDLALVMSTSLSSVGVVPVLSLLTGDLLRGLTGDLDLEMELVFRRVLRGDGLLDMDGERLRLLCFGEREREESEGDEDLRRVPLSELRPLPLPPRPRFRLSGDLDLRRGVEE